MPSRALPPNVRRVDHHDFHGWGVCLKRAGKRRQRYFSDRGDPLAALRRAVRWRNATAARLPPPRKFKRRYVRNTTGEIGVHLARQRSRTGSWLWYYGATWVDGGRSHKRSFSVAKYGKAAARARAVRVRRSVLAELLRPAKPGRHR
jgi:hypothetical protein